VQLKGMNLCDLCFSPAENGNLCEKCNTYHRNYQATAGILSPGTILLGKYIVGRSLGRGGFGVTYLAYANGLDRAVAIKEYLPASISYRGVGEENVILISEDKKDVFEKGAVRFFEEAKTISRFTGSDNIVSVYEFFHANNTVYYSMELLEGVDLKKYIDSKGGKLPEAEALAIFKHLCNALITVHATNTLHRDISPDNIFMCNDGKVKLIDFGAAKQVVSNESQSYSVVLKQGFAPTEQYARKGNQGPWTDIYAAGATIYYALTGKVPPEAFERGDGAYIDMPGVSQSLVAIINKCMHVKAEYRYQSAVELLNDLNRSYAATAETNIHRGYVQGGTVLQTGEYTAEIVNNQANAPVKKAQAEVLQGATAKGSQKQKKGLWIGLASGVAALVALFLVFAFGFSEKKTAITSNSIAAQETTTETTETGNNESSAESTLFSNGLLAVLKDGKWGYINENGEEVIPSKYDWALAFSECGLALVAIDDYENRKYGYINTKGEEIIQIKYDYFMTFAECGLALVAIDDYENRKYGYINTKGEEVIPLKYDDAWDFAECGLAAVAIGEDYSTRKYGYINTKGEEVVPPKYDFAGDFAECGLAAVKIGEYPNEKWGYINTKGEEVIPLKYDYDYAYDFAECGLAPVGKYGKWGYINTKGEEVIPLKYGYAGGFAECGLAMVAIGDSYEDYKWGYINTKGEEVIPLKYDDARDFAECGLAEVRIGEYPNEKWGYINAKGEEVIPLKFDFVETFAECDYVLAIINGDGEHVISFEMGESASSDAEISIYKNTGEKIAVPDGWLPSVLSNDSYIFWKDDKYGVADYDGKVIIEPIYDYINIAEDLHPLFWQ